VTIPTDPDQTAPTPPDPHAGVRLEALHTYSGRLDPELAAAVALTWEVHTGAMLEAFETIDVLADAPIVVVCNRCDGRLTKRPNAGAVFARWELADLVDAMLQHRRGGCV
jgi:hypothetical protein